MSTPQTSNSSPAQQLRDGAATGTWRLDPAASNVTTATGHFWGLITVRGRFTDYSGRGVVDTHGKITGTLEVEGASIDTKNNKRDQHLRSADFFDTDRHPSITFTATDVAFVNDTIAHVTGVLTARGARQDVTFDANVAAERDKATVSADVVIDHKALGMTWSPLGMTRPTTVIGLALTYSRS